MNVFTGYGRRYDRGYDGEGQENANSEEDIWLCVAEEGNQVYSISEDYLLE